MVLYTIRHHNMVLVASKSSFAYFPTKCSEVLELALAVLAMLKTHN